MTQVQTVANATRWSLIVRAQGSGADRRIALDELIGHYERFVVWLIQRHGHPPDTNAEDLKQDFLAGIWQRNDIAKLDRERGSFRAWLNLAVRRFLMNEWGKWRAARGGRKGTVHAPLELSELSVPPEDVCTREFASHVVSRALSLQRAESRDVQRFDALARFLPGPQLDPVDAVSLCAALGTTPNALRKAICQLRGRYRELLREAIADLLDLERNPPPPPDSSVPPGSPSATREATQLACSRAIDEELRELRRHFWS